ncbi:MAG: S1/P1 nuclease [Bacteroidetes bacterium]|nr:S1/P1 nuclease [Bacteroidota bacterium]
MKTHYTAFIFILFLFSARCYAWGPEGHKYVAEIAAHFLKKEAKDSLQKYLGNMSLEDAAVWMDKVRKDHTYDYMKHWHFINIEKDKTYVKTEKPNVINQLEKHIVELNQRKGLGSDEVLNTLKIVIHLVGDIHMPLHCGYGSDKGGNEIKVLCIKKHTSLHHVWDDDIIRYKKITLDDCLKMANTFTAQQIQDIQNKNIEQWMVESRALLPMVYNFNDDFISQEYVNKNASIIKMQLCKAGLRLAMVLNHAFGAK